MIGGGRFGRAFISGLLKSQFSSKNIWASARSEANLSAIQKMGIRSAENFGDWISDTTLVLLSVKPAQIKGIIEKLNQMPLSEKTLIISVAAGTSISKIEKLLTKKCPVIRAMPNSPCTVQEGVTAICKGSNATKEHLELARVLFSTLGKCLEIDEVHFDSVTALSGSGPAYYYLLMEVMIEAGIKEGLTREQAVDLVAQTARGAATMVQNLNRSPTDLKKDVATPGGCTAEALKILEERNVPSIFAEAISKATAVAANLGKN
ncbi:MAG: proC [Bacteriovoracaceae bacterium]|nr:proC [Bacteriovoracaceae bacterium]